MRFDLVDLRLFVNVAEAGTITTGAEGSHMTLASASERIRAMEDSLGSALLLRERRGVSVTPAGRTLLHHARLVLQQVERLQGELGDYGAGIRGHVHMLCNTAAATEYLPEVLSSFLKDHDGISVDLDERPSDEIVDAVRGDLCDLGLVSDAVEMGGVQTFAFRSDPLVLIVSKAHPLASQTSVSLVDVVNEAFVGLAKGNALQEHLALQARRLGKRMHYRIQLRSLDAICRMVGRGVGVGIVPQAAAIRYGRSAGIKRLKLTDPWAMRHLVLCMRDMDDLSPASKLLAQHILAGVPRGASSAT